MNSSLRSRQLVSGFSIIVVGILILGALLHFSLYQTKKEEAATQLKQTALTLLGYLEFSHGKFKIADGLEKDANTFLSSVGMLIHAEREQFAYIYDIGKKELVWSTHDLDQINSSERSREDASATAVMFDFEAINHELDQQEKAARSIVQVMKPVPPNHTRAIDEQLNDVRDKVDETLPDYNTEYQISLQRFTYKPEGQFIFLVAQSLNKVNHEMSTLRVTFAVLFFVSVVLILIAQLASSFWVVAPIKEFEDEVHSIQLGEKELIIDDYPEELIPIKNTINALISHESGQKQRYKDSLDDLAHSLKTPLAAIRSQLELSQVEPATQKYQAAMAGIASQVDYMQEIISRQLRKAMVTQGSAIIVSQPVRPILMRLAETMKKVYRDKDFQIRILVDDYAKCRLDAEDLMELMGNLISNACRFCDQLVEVSSHISDGMLIIDIDDDGMGFPSENPSKLLQRGIREDSKTEGQGIGLAVSTEIVAAVGGKIELLVSPQVGARVRLHLPI